MFYIEMTILNEFPLEDEPVSLDSFYVIDSPLSVTNIAQTPMFYLN